MRYSVRFLFAFCVLTLLPAPLAAQFTGTFGRSVELDGDQLFVVKPAAGRGPAAVYVYEMTPQGWTETQRLGTDVTTETGEGIGPGIVAADDLLLVGSADPEARNAAWAFRRQADGSWTAIDPIPMNPGTEPEARGKLDMAALMKILAPAQRRVATDGDRVLVSSVTPQGIGSAQLMDRDADTGRWRIVSKLTPESGDVSGAYGASLLLTPDRAFVGAPQQDQGGGAVYVYEAGPDGWSESARIDGKTVGEARRIGAALGLRDDVLIVGAPGDGDDAGSAVMLQRNADGTWQEIDRVAAPGPAAEQAGNDFGWAIDVAESGIWIGAPGANAVYRVEADADQGWTVIGGVEAVDLGGGLGASLAAGPNRLAAGAPSADGGVGRVAVYTPDRHDAWTPTVIEPAGALETITGAETRCADGEAAGFSCENVDLLSYLTIESLGGKPGETMSDIWGWTDPETGKEYGLVGRTAGMVILDLSQPANPVVLGTVTAPPSGARDIKTYADHAYFTGDGAPDHGLVVFDLTRVRDLDGGGGPATLEPDAVYHEFGFAHNLAIDTESGFAFVVRPAGGGQTCGGGLHMVDIRDPEQPTFAGCYTDTAGVIKAGSGHDTQCVVYHGPDADYQGRELCFASNESVLRIVDVTDKQNPIEISSASYPAQAYIHQGWLTDDQRYFYLDDELDEIVGNTERTRTLIWDLTDLDDPTFAGDLMGPDGSTDHNLYVKGDRMYQANYQAGLRVIDVSQPTEPVEVGHFDTTPYGKNPPGFGGAWTAYPFFDSGTVIVSSIAEGLFVLRPNRPLVP
ncbi:MAG: choice-of-anchor B family protein [Gemmatimonadales bacterium]|jgi:choice-of-anchor B domain-containing protein